MTAALISKCTLHLVLYALLDRELLRSERAESSIGKHVPIIEEQILRKDQ